MECSHSMTVIAGGLVRFSKQAPPSLKDNVLDTLLFAGLYANGKAPKFESPEQWQLHHDNALKNLRWSLLSSQTNRVTLAHESVDIVQLIESEWLRRLPKAASDGIREALVSLAATPVNDQARELFYRSALKPVAPDNRQDQPRKPDATRVFAHIAYVGPDGVLCSLHLNYTTCASGDVLRTGNFAHRVQGEVRMQFAQRQWNASRYENVKPEVLKYLEHRRSGETLPVTLALGNHELPEPVEAVGPVVPPDVN